MPVEAGIHPRRIVANADGPRYSAEYRRCNAEHVDSEHTLEDIVYIRNTPYVASILKMVRDDYLSRDDFPFLLKPPADYSVKSDKPPPAVEETHTDFTPRRKRRLILVVVGGLTYTELHHLRTLSKALEQQLVIVTTSMLNPQAFVKALSEVSMFLRWYYITCRED